MVGVDQRLSCGREGLHQDIRTIDSTTEVLLQAMAKLPSGRLASWGRWRPIQKPEPSMTSSRTGGEAGVKSRWKRCSRERGRSCRARELISSDHEAVGLWQRVQVLDALIAAAQHYRRAETLKIRSRREPSHFPGWTRRPGSTPRIRRPQERRRNSRRSAAACNRSRPLAGQPGRGSPPPARCHRRFQSLVELNKLGEKGHRRDPRADQREVFRSYGKLRRRNGAISPMPLAGTTAKAAAATPRRCCLGSALRFAPRCFRRAARPARG